MFSLKRTNKCSLFAVPNTKIIIVLKFCFKDFQDFKNKLQEENFTQFYIATIKSSGDEIFFRCNRFQSKNSPKSESQAMERSCRAKGITRITSSCPVFLKKETKNGVVHAKFCLNHIGHPIDSTHLSLTPSQKAKLALLMKSNQTNSSIKEEIFYESNTKLLDQQQEINIIEIAQEELANKIWTWANSEKISKNIIPRDLNELMDLKYLNLGTSKIKNRMASVR